MFSFLPQAAHVSKAANLYCRFCKKVTFFCYVFKLKVTSFMKPWKLQFEIQSFKKMFPINYQNLCSTYYIFWLCTHIQRKKIQKLLSQNVKQICTEHTSEALLVVVSLSKTKIKTRKRWKMWDTILHFKFLCECIWQITNLFILINKW